MKYNLIVAMCRGDGIGHKGKLPWHIKEDLHYFSKLTKADEGSNKRKAVIMGSRTWRSLPQGEGGLAGRDNYVLTASGSLDFDMHIQHDRLIKTFRSIEALERFINSLAFKYDEIWVIGGASIYRAFLDAKKIQKCYVTYIDKMFEYDTLFPGLINFEPDKAWREISRKTTYNEKYACEVDYVVYDNDATVGDVTN